MTIERVIFTGGGSGGHVMPAINLIKKLKSSYYLEILYVGSSAGIEKELIKKIDIPYKEISSGKLRRYFSIENLIDLFRVVLGVFESFFYLLSFDKKTIVVSTGGFVSVPVVIAGFLTLKKVYIHEQTSRVGLANKIASVFAHKVFISFEQSRKYFPKEKTIYTGYPLREDLFLDNVKEIYSDRPILFITGGGNGSKLLNDFVDRNLEKFLTVFDIHHQVGARFINEYKKKEKKYYHTYNFVDSMTSFLKSSQIILSRSGAGMICELIALGKKSIFVPLKIAQKNEQFYNAQEAKQRLSSIIIEEDDLLDSDDVLLNEIFHFEPKQSKRIPISQNGTYQIIKEILET